MSWKNSESRSTKLKRYILLRKKDNHGGVSAQQGAKPRSTDNDIPRRAGSKGSERSREEPRTRRGRRNQMKLLVQRRDSSSPGLDGL